MKLDGVPAIVLLVYTRDDANKIRSYPLSDPSPFSTLSRERFRLPCGSLSKDLILKVQ